MGKSSALRITQNSRKERSNCMVPATAFWPRVKKQNAAPKAPQARPSRRPGFWHRPRTAHTKQTPQNKQKAGGAHT